MRQQALTNTDVRRQYARLLRRYLSGEISNFQYEEGYDSLLLEPAVDAIHHHVAWFMYSDLRELRAERLDRDTRREIAKIILFLRTDLPLGALPPLSLAQRIHTWLLVLTAVCWLGGVVCIVTGWVIGDITLILVGGMSCFAMPAYLYARAAVCRLARYLGLDFDFPGMPSAWPYSDASAFDAVRVHGSGFLGSRDPLDSSCLG